MHTPRYFWLLSKKLFLLSASKRHCFWNFCAGPLCHTPSHVVQKGGTEFRPLRYTENDTVENLLYLPLDAVRKLSNTEFPYCIYLLEYAENLCSRSHRPLSHTLTCCAKRGYWISASKIHWKWHGWKPTVFTSWRSQKAVKYWISLLYLPLGICRKPL